MEKKSIKIIFLQYSFVKRAGIVGKRQSNNVYLQIGKRENFMEVRTIKSSHRSVTHTWAMEWW